MPTGHHQHKLPPVGDGISHGRGLATRRQARLPELVAVVDVVGTQVIVKRAGVGDHESTVKLLQKMQKDGRDSDLKALAGKMLPTVGHHLEMARELAASTASAKS